MSLMSVMWKDIIMLVGMGLEHWIHKTFVQVMMDLFGQTRVRVRQMRNIKRRERYLIKALQASISSMRDYRALVKAGYDPSNS